MTSVQPPTNLLSLCHCSRNEELDDKVVIKKLKKRVAELERELETLRETRDLPSPVG